jgi:hypothetical protein
MLLAGYAIRFQIKMGVLLIEGARPTPKLGLVMRYGMITVSMTWITPFD